MKNIQDIIDSLDPGTYEKCKDIIEECKQRELDIREATLRSQISLLKCDAAHDQLFENLVLMNKQVSETHDQISTISLLLEEQKFLRHCDSKKKPGE